MKATNQFFYALSFTCYLVLTACGSGSGNDNPDPSPTPDPIPTPEPTPTETITGLLNDIQGLAYISGETTGITDIDGIFEYEDGETVTFRIGDIVIGE